MPPGVDNHRLTLADGFVVPAPNLGLDGFTHCGHVLEVVVVLGGFIMTGFAQHANGRGRGVEDVDIQALGDSPYPARVGVGRDTFVEDAGRSQRQRTVNNIGVARDPADVGHAPVNILGMNVLDVFGGTGHIREVAASAVLAAFGLSGAAAGVHEEQRRLRIHGDGRHDLTRVIGEHFVNPEIAPFHKRRSRRTLAGVPAPDQDLVHHMAFLFGKVQRDVGGRFVVEHLAVAIVTIHRDQDVAGGIGGAQAASLAAEAPKHNRVNHSQAGAGQHGDRQLGNHRHMNGDAVSALQAAEIAQQRREFIHSHIEFAIGDGYGRFGFRLRYKDQSGFVLVLGEVPVHAVVRGVDLAAHEPLPERRIAGVKRGVPVLVPAQQIGVLPEALREILLTEALEDARIGQIRLADKFRGRIVVFLLAPMDCDLSLGGVDHYIRFLTNFSHSSYPLRSLNL